jgi:hypothetical protein
MFEFEEWFSRCLRHLTTCTKCCTWYCTRKYLDVAPVIFIIKKKATVVYVYYALLAFAPSPSIHGVYLLYVRTRRSGYFGPCSQFPLFTLHALPIVRDLWREEEIPV